MKEGTLLRYVLLLEKLALPDISYCLSQGRSHTDIPIARQEQKHPNKSCASDESVQGMLPLPMPYPVKIKKASKIDTQRKDKVHDKSCRQ